MSIPVIISFALGIFVLWYCSSIIKDYDDDDKSEIPEDLAKSSWVILVIGIFAMIVRSMMMMRCSQMIKYY